MTRQIYYIISLNHARLFFRQNPDVIRIITNAENTIRYYGIMVLDYMFSNLKLEFTNQISDIIIDVECDNAALFTALKLGYKNIVYNNQKLKLS